MKLTFLGTASGLPTPNRFTQSIVLEGFDQINILDPGDGASSLLYRNDFSHKDINNIIISHMHIDHVSGIFQIIKTANHCNKRSRLNIILPEEGIEAIKNFLKSCYLPIENINFDINFLRAKNIKHLALEDSQNLKITSRQNQHLIDKIKNMKPTKTTFSDYWDYQSFSFEFSTNNNNIVYTGNLAKKLNEINEMLGKNKVLITEMAHLNIDEVFNTIKNHEIKKTYMSHFHPELELDVLKNKIEEFDLEEKVFLAYDGFTVDLNE